MITALHNVKEVEITEHKKIKYYQLYIYDPSSDDPNCRYCIIYMTTILNDINQYQIDYPPSEGQEYRIFTVELPMGSLRNN